MLEQFMTTENIIALLALSAMEIVLGIDNIVFLSIISGKLPKEQQAKARKIGLALALILRLLLLFTISHLVKLIKPIFSWSDIGVPITWIEKIASGRRLEGIEEINGVSWRDVILIVGGFFLIAKSVLEIHDKMEGAAHDRKVKVSGFISVIAQIAMIDIIFSLDSVITAVGMAKSIVVMSVAVIIAMLVMFIFAEPVSKFVEKNPTIKMLALSFLILIGVMLLAEGVGTEIERGYIYFAMAFALVVEMLNLKVRKLQST
jgi:predicted tellurium resistance membrane protein TerC